MSSLIVIRMWVTGLYRAVPTIKNTHMSIGNYDIYIFRNKSDRSLDGITIYSVSLIIVELRTLIS